MASPSLTIHFMNFTYRQRLLFYFSIIFVIFSVFVTAFQFSREKQYKTESLESTLEGYSFIVYNFIHKKEIDQSLAFEKLDTLCQVMAEGDARVTIISPDGKVLFDSFVEDYQKMDNHFQRPEVQTALKRGNGAMIRFSNTTKKDYYYYAVDFGDLLIRTALPYDVKTITFLKADNLFIYFMLILFIVVLFSLILTSGQLGKSISQLKEFAYDAGHNRPIPKNIHFVDNELGVISKQIVKIYSDLKQTQEALSLESEKLMQHLQVAQSGLAVFSSEKKLILANSHFTHFIGLISDNTDAEAEKVFQINELKELNSLLARLLSESGEEPGDFNMDSFPVKKGSRHFNVSVVVFRDKSFEIVISDITKQEKSKKIKRELTNNIAHELKTPVATVQGYLETIVRNTNLPEEKRNFFLNRAFKQSIRLGELIDDISTLSKVEEAQHLFDREPVKIKEIVQKITQDIEFSLIENEIQLNNDVTEACKINGNRALVYSIFRNLIDNSIKYAGKGALINISLTNEDDQFYHFSYADNGPGVEEEHLNRLFERFYRVDNGRSRKMGGTGLGLAIVKNAVLYHGGEISAKNRPNDGLEFLFSLQKDME